MILKVFSVFDTKAEAYIPPFYCATSGIAVRNFEQAANEEGHAFQMHAQDYCLFELGEFDDHTGIITMKTAPIALGLAQNYIKGLPPVTLSEVK